MPLNLFQYDFVVRGFEAGIAVALIAPLIGMFLVLKRYALIADTLAHVSLAGIALGLLAGVNPPIAALVTTVLASLGIERLRASRRVYGESALALFLSGSLALAVVLLGLAKGLNASLFNYLFGSIVTVTAGDVRIILALGAVVVAAVMLFYKEFLFTTFDEEAARVSGVPVAFITTLLMVLAALTVSISIPIVGVLLIAALIVIPAITALQFKKGFTQTIMYAEVFSLVSVVAGMAASFYLNLSSGGTIVLIMLGIYGAVLWLRR